MRPNLSRNIESMQSTGAYKAAARLAIATPPPAYVLSRGIGWQVNHFKLNSFLFSPYYFMSSCKYINKILKIICPPQIK